MKSVKYVKMVPVTVMVPVVPLLSIVTGAALLIFVIWPILSFQLTSTQISGTLISPLSDEFVVSANAEEITSDFTHVSNWFPELKQKKTVTPVDTYLLSIPKLRIVNAQVKIGSDDLAQNLIHFGGSGIPGKFGNSVIFGHSVLPAFYDPSNYLTIFSLLPTLEENDDIFVKFDGMDYRFKVENQIFTTPEDVSGLEQRYDDAYLTLVTCVPPGTYWQRLWLTARQVPFDQK